MDVRDAFGQAKALPSSVLLHRLRADEEAPWIDLGPGGLTVRKLANMLREYDISPANHRWEDGTETKGYLRMDFHDAWSRSVPEHVPAGGAGSTVPGVAAQVTAGRHRALGRHKRPGPPIRPTPDQPRDGWDGWGRTRREERPMKTPRERPADATTADPFAALPVLISVPRAADILGLSRATAYRLAATEELPVRRLAGRVYVITARLSAFVNGDSRAVMTYTRPASRRTGSSSVAARR